MVKFQFVLLLLLLVTTDVFADNLDYPSSYRDLGLPEYENAVVTDLGRVNTTLRDGITLTLFTTDDGATLRAYYEAEMQRLGWALEETAASKKMRAAGMLDKLPFGAVFSKNDMRFQIFSNPKGDGLAVRINLSGK